MKNNSGSNLKGKFFSARSIEGLDSWFDIVEETKNHGLVFFACGVFLSLIKAMAERFPEARLVFDARNSLGIRFELKALRKADINVSTNFYLNRPVEELRAISPRIAHVETHGTATEYSRPDPRFGMLFAIIAGLADIMRVSQINAIDFA